MNAQQIQETLSHVYLEMIDMLVAKGSDYSGETDTFNNFKLSATVLNLRVETVIMSRLLDKVNRIGSLLNKESANFESIEDTYKDLIGYASLLYLWHISNKNTTDTAHTNPPRQRRQYKTKKRLDEENMVQDVITSLDTDQKPPETPQPKNAVSFKSY